MHPLNFTRPKVMLRIANKPIVEWNVLNAIQAGIKEFVFVVGYRSEMVRDYFGDGSIRQAAPISPAIHLGADKVLIVGVSNKPKTNIDDLEIQEYPSLGKIGGHILSSIFIDSLEADLERLNRINKTIDAIPSHHLEENNIELRKVEALVISPSKDLQKINALVILANTIRRIRKIYIVFIRIKVKLHIIVVTVKITHNIMKLPLEAFSTAKVYLHYQSPPTKLNLVSTPT